MTAIEIVNLTHTFNVGSPFERTALKDINFAIDKGEFVGIIGHTGSGKSTLIQMFNSLIIPTKGKVLINGVDINGEGVNKKEIRQNVGLVFQYPEHQLFELTIFKDVAYGPINLGLSEQEVEDRVVKSLRAVGLAEDLWQAAPFQLSGGQKRRVAIAGVIAMNPGILVLDEPTAGLDPKGRDELFQQLKSMHKELGITVVLISHSMEDVAKYVEKLIVLHKGSLKYMGTPREIFKNVEELESIGLAPPQIKYIVKALRENGFMIDEDILTVDEAANRIMGFLKAREV
ncbi:MAG: energy-coupling factor transporter ATPase [Epulopiscium sp. Nele67-Bin002]|nr:MAG: energy-coupling factor transporter ATPase [Epulopiscium sp. Nuni2H_MBin001]OON92304.1 MAG: energy-coupling factor transporter ATPase [Epulopiscium sp. Nele67-Bin002]